MKRTDIHTPQDLFDYVAQHLLSQGEQSLSYAGCSYRGMNTNTRKVLACAAGCLISDSQYDPAFEGTTAGVWHFGSMGVHEGGLDMEGKFDRGERIYTPEHLGTELDQRGCDIVVAIETSLNRKLAPDEVCLVRELQDLHDRSQPDQWRERLAKVAQNYGLSAKVVQPCA